MPEVLYATASVKASTGDNNAQSYRSMTGKLNESLLKALEVMGYEYMTPVQSKVLTELPSFRSDCLVQAKTGTGKTVAFLLPTLHSLLASSLLPKGKVGVLIMSPTRELAMQITQECNQLTSQLPRPLECHTAYGGTRRAGNLSNFLHGDPSILVATPGRLQDYLSEPKILAKFDMIQTLILDEADTMLKKGFLADVSAILKLLPPKQTGWQGMCFSATIPSEIKSVMSVILSPQYTSLSTIDHSEPLTVLSVLQYHVVMRSAADTFRALYSLLQYECIKESKIIVFGVTANMVALYAAAFVDQTPVKVYQLHSRLNQNIRTRTTEEFKATASGILFASDVVGRGMDFPNVDLIIQVGLPTNAEQYVHRVGRTARAGNEGRAIILLSEAESFFLRQNRNLPIEPHPQSSDILNDSAVCSEKMEQVMASVDESVKTKAYSSYMGFLAGSGLCKALGLDKAGIVQVANSLALDGMGCPEVPALEKMVVGKMGLKGIPGLQYAPPKARSAAPHRPPKRSLQSQPATNERPYKNYKTPAQSQTYTYFP